GGEVCRGDAGGAAKALFVRSFVASSRRSRRRGRDSPGGSGGARRAATEPHTLIRSRLFSPETRFEDQTGILRLDIIRSAVQFDGRRGRAKLLVVVIPESPAPGGRYCSGVITATPQSVPVMVVAISHVLA